VADSLLRFVGRLAGPLLVAIVAGLAFGESAIGLDFIVPGEAGMVVGGAAGARARLPLAVLIAAGTVGAVAGDTVSYLVGRRFGVRLVRRWRFTRRHLEPALERAHTHFERRGGLAVFTARFIGALRAIVPAVAGSAGMPLPRFLAWDIVAAALWATITITVGYTFGDDIARAFDRGWWTVSLVILAVLALVFYVRRRKRTRVEEPT
jgi:membrane protein DedA with SNARE-associated domain